MSVRVRNAFARSQRIWSPLLREWTYYRPEVDKPRTCVEMAKFGADKMLEFKNISEVSLREVESILRQHDGLLEIWNQ